MYRNDPTVLLSGGVGGARMARGLAAVLDEGDLTVVVNVGDDDEMYGLHVAADLDTVTYTLAATEGREGWGVRDDTFATMEGLAELGIDTRFRLGDRDLVTCLARTISLSEGGLLSAYTTKLAAALGVAQRILPATDDVVRTEVQTPDGTWLGFQDYFVLRGTRDEVAAVRYRGADAAKPAPGVVDAIRNASLVVIAPSNPPLSVWPILAVPGIREAVADHPCVIAVSPLIGGRALKGPADRVMASLGLPAGNEGVAAAYTGLLDHLVIDHEDTADIAMLQTRCPVTATDTRIAAADAAARLAAEIIELGGC
ncbi:MAG: 2-phospho-L-lactate transferase [Acidimicrobiia bacterium]